MGWQEIGRRWGGWLGGILWFLFSCDGGGGVCVNGVQLSEYNTSGLRCTKACDCSNLKYEGYCISGQCITNPRNVAQRKGEVRSCRLLEKVGTCGEGTQEAQPAPLKELLWGDCIPPVRVPENTRATCLDGKDNDCNGLVDLNEASCAAFCQPGQQAPCYTGSVETLNQGRCRAGIKTCGGDNQWGGCVGEVQPATTEVCNAQDDDCNGLIDDGLSGCPTTQRCVEGTSKPCYSGLAGCVAEKDASGAVAFRCVGACRAGEQRCVGGAWTGCTGQVVPQAEACDGTDKDCDGTVDEGCGCTAGKERVCFLSPQQQEIGECTAGKQRCVSGSWGPCEGAGKPSLEICDGKDNNCDGVVDEGCAVCKEGETRTCYTGPNNTEGTGVCKSGTETCINGQWGVCTGESLPEKQEICGDNLDNNCNGQTDEGCGVCTSGQTRPCYTGSVNTRGVGVCKDGTETCVGRQWEACVGEVKPEADKCGDHLDNDCNGKIDDAPECSASCSDGQTRPCYTGSLGTNGVGECKEGNETCQNRQWSGACIGEVKPNGQEICGNNKDDNCNGKVDEDCFGPIDYGGICKPSDPTLRCQVGLICWSIQGDTIGICSRRCNSSSCPSNSRCETINTTTGDRVCFVNCTTNANCLSMQNCDSRINACYPVIPRNCRLSDPLGACSSDSECCSGQTCDAAGLTRNCGPCVSNADCPKIGGFVPTSCCTQTSTGQTLRYCATTCP